MQFTASMVEAAYCQDESIRTYEELVRELAQPFGDREPETEENQWYLTNSLAPYATVARTDVVHCAPFDKVNSEFDRQELLTMLRELGNESTLTTSSLDDSQDGVSGHVDNVQPEEDSAGKEVTFTNNEETPLLHQQKSDEVEGETINIEVKDPSAEKSNTDHEESVERVSGHSEERIEGTNDHDKPGVEKEENEKEEKEVDCDEMKCEIDPNEEVQDEDEEGNEGHSQNSHDKDYNEGNEVNILEVRAQHLKDDEINTEANEVIAEKGEGNLVETGTRDETCAHPVKKSASLDAATTQVQKEAEFLNIDLKSVAGTVKESDKEVDEKNELSEEEARRRAGQKLEKRRSTLSTAPLTQPKTRTRSMAPNGRVAHMMAQFGEQWLLEEEESSDEEGN